MFKDSPGEDDSGLDLANPTYGRFTHFIKDAKTRTEAEELASKIPPKEIVTSIISDLLLDEASEEEPSKETIEEIIIDTSELVRRLQESQNKELYEGFAAIYAYVKDNSKGKPELDEEFWNKLETEMSIVHPNLVPKFKAFVYRRVLKS